MIFDDQLAIAENPTIRSLWPPTSIFLPPTDDSAIHGRPLANATLALNYALAGPTGLRLEGYHAFNLAVHLSAAIVLFGLVRRTLQLPKYESAIGDHAVPTAFAVSLLWTVHPLTTEAVTYLVQRTESLMALAYLLVLYCLLRGATSSRAQPWYGAAVCACAAGMATKEVMVSAPLVALVYDRVFLSESWRQCIGRRGLLYLGLFATWGILAALLFMPGGRGTLAEVGPGMSSWEYARLQFGYIVHYLQLCFWPRPLVIDYGPAFAVAPHAVWWYATITASMVGATIAAFFYRPWLGFLGLAFFAILSPTTSVVPLVREVAAERRIYLPLAAVITAAVIVAIHIGRTYVAPHCVDDASRRRLRNAGWYLLMFLAVISARETRRRNWDYQSDVAIWADASKKQPLNARAHLNLGNELFDLKRFGEALTSFQRAVELRPLYLKARINLGNTLIKLKKHDEAISVLEEAIRVGPDPWADAREQAVAQFNLGNALLELGRTSEAERHFLRAVESAPQFDAARTNLAVIYLGQERSKEAVDQFRAVVELHPERPAAHSNLGVALMQSGRVYEAVRHYRRALELDPEEVTTLNNLAWIMATCPDSSLRNGAQGVDYAAKAVRHFDGQNIETQRTLAAALAECGRFDEAVCTAFDAIHLAHLQENAPLMKALRAELECYQANVPYRDHRAMPTDK